MRNILLLLFLIAGLPLMAQDNYLVTKQGDTLRGDVRILSYDVMDRAAIKVGGKKKNFTAIEVRTICTDSTWYSPVQYENTIRFMQVIQAGYLSLYGFKPENSQSYDGRLLGKMDGSKLEVPNIQFKRILGGFLEDCESVSEKVKGGDYGRDQLKEIVVAYNDCVKEQNKKSVIAVSNASPLTDAIYKLRAKVDGSSLASKKDVLDLLTSMDAKARLKEPVPGYLTEGLKSYLAGKPEFEQELNTVLGLLN